MYACVNLTFFAVWKPFFQAVYKVYSFATIKIRIASHANNRKCSSVCLFVCCAFVIILLLFLFYCCLRFNTHDAQVCSFTERNKSANTQKKESPSNLLHSQCVSHKHTHTRKYNPFYVMLTIILILPLIIDGTFSLSNENTNTIKYELAIFTQLSPINSEDEITTKMNSIIAF